MLSRLILTLVILAFTFAHGMKRVVVTGAAGKTGKLVFQKLLNSSFHSPLGLVRTKKSLKKLLKIGGAKEENVSLGDVTSPEAIDKSFAGADSVILCTSAVPKIKLWSLLKVFVLKLFGKKARPEFYFCDNGDPFNVDWLGAKNQIDGAKKAGIKHFVFLSSMGGSQPDNFLNSIGRVEGDEKSGNILLWKRKAEEYLIDSGMKYTIIHPGGLTDKKGGLSEVILGSNDELLNGEVRSIPRDDVASVCISALESESAANRSIDIVAKVDTSADKSEVTTDWNKFWDRSGDCMY